MKNQKVKLIKLFEGCKGGFKGYYLLFERYPAS